MSSYEEDRVETAETVVTAVDDAPRAEVTTGRPKRVLVLSLIHRPQLRLVNYVQNLAGRGDDVHVFVSRVEHWQEIEDLDPRIRLHPLDRPEEQLLVRRVERALVFRGPRAVSNVVGLVAGQRWGRPLRRPAEVVSRAQTKVSGAVHKRLFMPTYRALRPRLLATRFDEALRGIDFGTVDLVVAADVYTVTLAARLARLHPSVRVTTGLEL
ncbi:hypothetical protein [Micromonospora cathayae]|uniref:Uncharacterized protein n=1 Tax=Micromonospora cathayae TaxID=3028804 RepID=A0ABY7ZYC9_9ACTN|nr:hypothetical protein [Micromonospora sp. HUAS 3]WDZ87811.1 hypothetical protein PVK37_16085 [Micromonospora sp. HUAS 3]